MKSRRKYHREYYRKNAKHIQALRKTRVRDRIIEEYEQSKNS